MLAAAPKVVFKIPSSAPINWPKVRWGVPVVIAVVCQPGFIDGMRVSQIVPAGM